MGVQLWGRQQPGKNYSFSGEDRLEGSLEVSLREAMTLDGFMG
jgi:hypothetical protein